MCPGRRSGLRPSGSLQVPPTADVCVAPHPPSPPLYPSHTTTPRTHTSLPLSLHCTWAGERGRGPSRLPAGLRGHRRVASPTPSILLPVPALEPGLGDDLLDVVFLFVASLAS